MKKLAVAMALVASTGFASAGAWDYQDFHSWNKPLNPKMANYDEMMKYRQDVNSYLKGIDQEIQKLIAKRNKVTADFNKAAMEFNADDFFHPGAKKIKLFRPYRYQQYGLDKDLAVIFWSGKSKKDYHDLEDLFE